MSRQGRNENVTRQSKALMVECKNMVLIIHGCGERTAGRFEGCAAAGLPAVLETSKIQEISWIDFDLSSVKKAETIFSNDFVLTEEGVSLTQTPEEE